MFEPAVIVSRHPAAIEFIKPACGTDVPVLSGNVTPDEIAGKLVYGNVPLHLAAVAAEVVAVEFDGTPPRGQEYTLDDMVAAGATLRSYHVFDAQQLSCMAELLHIDAIAMSNLCAAAKQLAAARARTD